MNSQAMIHPNGHVSTPSGYQFFSPKLLIRAVSLFLWLLFAAGVLYLSTSAGVVPELRYGQLIRINGFTLLVWTTVTFFSALVNSYSLRYLDGFKRQWRFTLLALGFTFSVMLLVAAQHVLLLWISWGLMGLFMSHLIGVDRSWRQARSASAFTRRYFYAGTLFLGLGLLILSIASGTVTLQGLTQALPNMPYWVSLSAALCIITAAIIQSATYPFQRWLLSAMTAPTPASALMHAGFVNGGGILLALFASLMFSANSLTILFIIGGLTAILAQFAKLLQVNVKHRLACSTIAQMGFMIMQCGLGFFNAAIAHLILHGFYKAYLFLSSGEEVSQALPQKPLSLTIKPLQVLLVLVFGVMGAGLFVYWTGKGTRLDSGLFLTLIVAITVGQLTYNIVKERSLTNLQKFVITPLLFMLGIGLYTLVYKGVTLLMADTPMHLNPVPMTGVQITFGSIFLLGFFIMKLGLYKKIPWLYVKLMNVSQPYANAV